MPLKRGDAVNWGFTLLAAINIRIGEFYSTSSFTYFCRMSHLSDKNIASVFGKAMVTLRVSNANVDTPVPPKLLFTVSELRQQMAKRPGMSWRVVEHENAQQFITEKYDLVNKVMEWKSDSDSDGVSNSGDTLSVLYESGEQYSMNTDRWYESCSSSSKSFPGVASRKSDFSRPPSATDTERTEFLFDLNQVTDVDPVDPWLQTARLQNNGRGSGQNHPTRLPDVVVPAMRRCPRANIISWRSCNCLCCNGPASWWEWALMVFHCLAIVGLWGVLIFSVVQLFREGAHIRQSEPVTVVPEFD